MRYIKLFLIVALFFVFVPCASASWFNETSADLFTDVEYGLKELVLGFIGICLIGSVVAVLIGWFGHNNSLFKQGVGGFGIIIFIAIIYFIAVEVFNYFVTNYW